MSKIREKVENESNTDVSSTEDIEIIQMPAIEKKEIPPNLKVRSASVMKLPQIPKKPTEAEMKDIEYVLNEPLFCAGYRRYLQFTFAEENLDFFKSVEVFRTRSKHRRKE